MDWSWPSFSAGAIIIVVVFLVGLYAFIRYITADDPDESEWD